jgi:hypothetical protein
LLFNAGMKQLVLSALMASFVFACGGAEQLGDEATSEDAVYTDPILIDVDVDNGCAAIGRVEATLIARAGGTRVYRVKAGNVGANSTVRFDSCTTSSGIGCADYDDAPGWSLVSRETATQGPNGNYSATTYAVVSSSGLARFRAKEAKGTAYGNECAYNYSIYLP